MVEVEATQDIWFALPPPNAGWRSDREHLEQFADPLGRAVIEIDLADPPLRRRLRDADQVRRTPGDDDVGG
ncbi:MAG: hypothetical protein ACRYG4_15750 [Janthinobacterium lividum]